MVCWQEPGLQRLAQPPGCFGDRIPVTCHPRKICMSHSCPLSISNMSIPIMITSRSYVCVYSYACILLFVCLFELQVIRGRTYAAAYFSVYFHIFLSLCVLFFHEVGTNSPLIGLFTEKIIRITKMVEFSALSNRFNHAKAFISSFFLTLVLFPSPLCGWVKRASCLSAVAAVINASASLTFRGVQKS